VWIYSGGHIGASCFFLAPELLASKAPAIAVGTFVSYQTVLYIYQKWGCAAFGREFHANEPSHKPSAQMYCMERFETLQAVNWILSVWCQSSSTKWSWCIEYFSWWCVNCIDDSTLITDVLLLLLGQIECMRCGLLRSMILLHEMSVSQSVCHMPAPCKNGSTDWGPVSGEDSRELKDHCVRVVTIPCSGGSGECCPFCCI